MSNTEGKKTKQTNNINLINSKSLQGLLVLDMHIQEHKISTTEELLEAGIGVHCFGFF